MQLGRRHRVSLALTIVVAALGALPAEAGEPTDPLAGWSIYGGVGASNAGLFTSGNEVAVQLIEV